MYFYHKYQINRCEIALDEDKQNERIKTWYQNEWSTALSHAHSQIRNYARANDIPEQDRTIIQMKQMIFRLKEFMKNIKPLVPNDIRNFLDNLSGKTYIIVILYFQID